MYKFNIVKDSTELRKAIVENPELPIVVMTSYDAVEEDFYWTYCSIVHCEVGEVLNCEIPWREGLVYNSRTKFEDDLADYLSGTIEGANEMTDKEFEHLLEVEKSVYDEYWHKAIIVKVNN